MLQHWASEREFYIIIIWEVIHYCVNSLSWLCLHVARFIFALRNITLDRYLDTRRKHLEHLWHDVRPEIYIYIAKIWAIEQTRKLASLAITRKCYIGPTIVPRRSEPR